MFFRIILNFLVKLARNGVGYRESTKSELVRGINTLRKYFLNMAKMMVLEGIIPNKELIFHFTKDELEQLFKIPDPALVFK